MTPTGKLPAAINPRLENFVQLFLMPRLGGKLRSGKNSTYLGAGGSENRPDLDRAIRGYKKQLAPKAGAD